ncbi:hypothetical protein [Kamptonema sp. UHCC 0994]|uniref:hypothetical protein n=1 Tax=Kamptonema sp. UHCC 0994 TaxID=3031329 RepID=UPI0023B913F7|nr:hypothetical protein [Kamptonema sp. UHCC 0994]MDF0553289.1 hypothetical protein [Kamptonema sp. UHCC 0994]
MVQLSNSTFNHLRSRKKEEGRRKKEEGRRKKEEGRRKKEEGGDGGFFPVSN